MRLLLVLAVSALLFSFDFGARMFTTNDEARFPLLARDILEHGQWIMPRLNGAPHVDKPPLHAWLIALASRPGGSVTLVSAVVPSLLAALAVVASAFWIGRRFFGPDAGLVSGLLTVGTYGVLTVARAPMPDMTFCAALTGAIAAYMAAELDGRRAWLIAFYALVGLAVWTKGPAGLLPMAVVLVDALIAHGWSGPVRLFSVPGLLLLVALLVPWWALAAAAVGGERFWIDVVRNDWLFWYTPFLGTSWSAAASPIVQTVTVLLPWSLLLPVAWWWARRAPEPARRPLRLMQVWFATSFAFFAFSHQQRMRYYLPLCPIAAVMIAGWWSAWTWRGKRLAFAAVWIAGAIGLSAWIIAEGARVSAESGLAEIARAVDRPEATVYAVNVPELVFAFHLQRPVHLISGAQLRELAADGHGGYFIVPSRASSSWPPDAPPRLAATGVINQRAVSLFVVDPSLAHGHDVPLPVRLEKAGAVPAEDRAKQLAQ